MCRERHSSPPDLGREIEAAGTESMKEGEPGLEPAAPQASLASWLGGEGAPKRGQPSPLCTAQNSTNGRLLPCHSLSTTVLSYTCIW